MKVRWLKRYPRVFTLASGATLYCMKRGQELYISGYDWFNTPRLKKVGGFKLIDDSDDQPDNPKVYTREEIVADKPDLKPEDQKQQVVMDKYGSVMTKDVTPEEKAKKVVKKNIKVKRTYTRIKKNLQ